MQTRLDVKWMDALARYASHFSGTTADNPNVGALIVNPISNTLIARAVTAPGGRPHAETQVIELAGEKAKNAILYVTLEPCHHHGKTPPCIDAVIAAGVQKVVIGQEDADPRTAGKSIKKLQDAGIKVSLLKDHLPSFELHRAFFTRVSKARPFISAKLAVSKDNMVGRIGKGNVPITGAEAKRWTHGLRARVDGIAVGAQTAILDDPALNVRLKGLEHQSPKPFILTQNPQKMPQNLRLLAGNAEMVDTSAGVSEALKAIAEKGINHLLVEGGPKLLQSLLAQGLIDRFYVLESEKIIGSNGLPAAPQKFTQLLEKSGFSLLERRDLGIDRLMLFSKEQ